MSENNNIKNSFIPRCEFNGIFQEALAVKIDKRTFDVTIDSILVTSENNFIRIKIEFWRREKSKNLFSI